MRNPYVIKLPPGATELDLRPVLEPLALQILAHFRSDLQHSKNNRGSVTTADVSEWFDNAAGQWAFTRLAEEINRADMLRALEQHGWTCSEPDKIRWHRYGHCWITAGREEPSLTIKMDILRRMAHELSREDLAGFVREILASRSLLDQIAWAADDE